MRRNDDVRKSLRTFRQSPLGKTTLKKSFMCYNNGINIPYSLTRKQLFGSGGNDFILRGCNDRV